MGVSNQWVNGWWPGKPVVVLTACFACVMLTWPWDQWKIPKFEVVWLVVDLLCLPRVFCRVLALAVCQPLAVVLGLIRVVQFHGSPSLFILGLPFWHLVPPLTGKGPWCCDFAQVPSKVGLYGSRSKTHARLVVSAWHLQIWTCVLASDAKGRESAAKGFAKSLNTTIYIYLYYQGYYHR